MMTTIFIDPVLRREKTVSMLLLLAARPREMVMINPDDKLSNPV